MDNLIGTPPNYAVPHKYIDMEQMEYLCHLNRFSKLSDDFLINGQERTFLHIKYFRWLFFKFTAFTSQRTTTEDTTEIKFSY